jgi:hypothetical protein
MRSSTLLRETISRFQRCKGDLHFPEAVPQALTFRTVGAGLTRAKLKGYAGRSQAKALTGQRFPKSRTYLLDVIEASGWMVSW